MPESSRDHSAGETLAEGELWVLVDAPEGTQEGEVTRFHGRSRFSADALGDNLHNFTATLSRSLSKVQEIGSGFELAEVSVNAVLSAEIGFQLIAKAGVEGGITLTFRRAATSTATP
jgi:hypothetical protein